MPKMPLLGRLLHDVPSENPQDSLELGAPAALTDREAWLCLKGRLATPPPTGSRLIWVLGPVAATLAVVLVVVWLRSPGARVPTGTAMANDSAATESKESALPAAVEPRPLESGSQLVSAESSIRVGLPEGSSALVEPRGALELLDLNPAHLALRLVSGAVYLRVTPKHVGDLRVYAGDYAVIVHGTGFRVQRLGDQLRVQLRHGSVEVRSVGVDSAKPGTFLKPGEELTVDTGTGAPLHAAQPKPISRGEMDLLAAEEGDTLAMKASDEAAPPEARPRHAAHATRDEPTQASGTVEPAAQTNRTSVPSLEADIARCRARFDSNSGEEEATVATGITLRLDLTVSETGQVLAAAAERSSVDPRLSGCLAEAALDWHLDAPPEALRGLQFVFPIKL